MDAGEALADLMEISSQVQAAVLVGDSGEPLGSTLEDDEAAKELARLAGDLLGAAAGVRPEEGTPALTQLEAATRSGSVFVVREAGRTIAATTAPSPAVGLVFYDLKTCLRALTDAPADAGKSPRRRRKQEGADASA